MERPRLRHRLGATAALLFVAVACLGTEEGGKGCSAREKPPALGADGPGTTAEPTVPLLENPPPPEEVQAEPAPLPDFSEPSWTRSPSRLGTYLVCWRPLGGKVPRNEDFTLEVWVLRDGAPVRDLLLAVNAWMPDHGHGMLRRPSAEAQPDGSFRIPGMLLHMRGHWQLFFEVIEQGLSETTECALEL